jgi:probable HAF family extracellular repeat protein
MRRLRLGTIAVLGVLVFPLLRPDSNLARAEQPTLYQVRQLGSLGGTTSAGNGINDRAWVMGASNLSGDQTTHATLWRDGATVDLGTLGGPNSAVLWPVKNNAGLIVGVAETPEIDPLGEAWSCSFFFPSATGHTCLGFVWQDGRMKPLPTLGGNNGFATGVNNRGQVVGWAENTVHDATCNAPQVLQFRAVLWDIRHDQVRELPPLPGDSVSAATAINDQGQVVGISGICDNAVGRFSAVHAVLWNNGIPVDLGDLGGEAWNTPMAINDRGEVVGFANLPGDDPGAFNAHAFLWTEGDGMRDLGTLPGDAISQALGINGRRQVVGLSCGGSGCRAFLWEGGVMTDLNTRVTLGYGGRLVFANDINDAGAISGQAIDPETGDAVAFVAAPLGENR